MVATKENHRLHNTEPECEPFCGAYVRSVGIDDGEDPWDTSGHGVDQSERYKPIDGPAEVHGEGEEKAGEKSRRTHEQHYRFSAYAVRQGPVDQRGKDRRQLSEERGC